MSHSSLRQLWEKAQHSRFLQDVSILSMSNAGAAVLSLAQAILLARWLGPEKFGVAVLVMSYPSLLFAFFDARSNAATLKFVTDFSKEGEPERALAVCKLGYSVDLVVALTTFLIALLTVSWAQTHIVKQPGTASLMIIYSLGFLPRAFGGTSRAVLTVLRQFKTLAIVNLTATFVRVALTLVLVFIGWGVSGVIWGSFFGMILSGLVLGILASSLMLKTWHASWIRAPWTHLHEKKRDIFRFLLFTDLSALTALLVKQADTVLLGYFRLPTEVGYYRLAKSLAGIVSLPIASLQSVTYQRMTSLSNHPLKLWEFAKQLAKNLGLPLGVLSFGGAFALSWLGLKLAGQSYQPALLALHLWIVAYSVWLTFFWLRPFYFANGWTDHWFYLNTIGAVFFLTIGFPLVTRSGFVGLTVARISFPLLVHIGGFFVGVLLLRKALSQGWTTKAGTWVSVTTVAKRKVKTIEAFNRQHARFITSMLSQKGLNRYFPPLVEGPSEKILTLEWIEGKPVTNFDEAVTDIACFQARLHTDVRRECSPGFDYVSFIVQRASHARAHDTPTEVQVVIGKLLEQLSTLPQLNQPMVASHPDLSPHNLIRTNTGLKIVDLELLGKHSLYLIDLFNVCRSFSLTRAQLEIYLESYKNAGGELHPLAKYWDQVMALWILRCLVSRLESGKKTVPRGLQHLQSQNQDNRITRFVGFEPQLLEIARCSQ